eukprot:gene1888-2142_t
MAYHCAANNCSSSSYKIKRWRQQFCTEHDSMNAEGRCTCTVGFQLFPFTTEKKNKEGKMMWKKLINLQDPQSKVKLWSPSEDSRPATRPRPTCSNADDVPPDDEDVVIMPYHEGSDEEDTETRDEEIIRETTAARFGQFKNIHSIIDCSEVFSQSPKSHVLQSATWPEYKHHNTVTFLVAVSPN